MEAIPESQQDRAVSLLRQKGMARLAELTKAGVTAATVVRMARKGLLVQLSRGIYQLPDVMFDTNHSLADAAKCGTKSRPCIGIAFHFVVTGRYGAGRAKLQMRGILTRT